MARQEMVRQLNDWLRRVPIWSVWVMGMIPVGLLVFDTLAGRLGVDPVRDIEHRLGRTTIYLLIATLCVTPLLKLTRVSLVRFRRAGGLLCFAYAVMHLLAWAVFDMGGRWGQMVSDIVRRPYLTIGMAALLILAILAATSSNAAIRALGGKRWKRLHQLSYLAVLLGVFHWLLAYKIWPAKPLLTAILILGLLGYRLLSAYPLTRLVRK